MKHRLTRTALQAARAGQTMIVMVVILVMLLVIALWNFDLHKILFVKHLSRNAGDSAALAAARWQGVTLNLIGNLNVMQAVSISDAISRGETNFVEAAAIANIQSRLSFVGPMVGLAAAQQAAKNNRLYVNEEFTEEMVHHAAEVLSDYEIEYPDMPWHNDPDPPNAWDDYAEMIATVAAQGIAAYPENRRLYTDYTDSGHYLLNPSFYDAISSSDWCWFLFNALDLLNDYSSWQDWPTLPVYNEPRPMNAEYFGLHIRKSSTLNHLPAMSPMVTSSDIGDLIRLMEEYAGDNIRSETAAVRTEWFCYRDWSWAPWATIMPENFPWIGEVKPEYDYAGADASIRVETRSERLTPGAVSRPVAWTAAAKPFGYLEGQVPPHRYGLVLPAFYDVRMIPLDASSAPAAGSRPGWGRHIHDHLPPYVAHGPSYLAPGCWYCRQLARWESDAFRQGGISWLNQNSSSCHRPTGGGGGGGGGGTRRGH